MEHGKEKEPLDPLEEKAIDVTARLLVEEGGILQGECRVGQGTAAAEEVSGMAPVLQEVRQGQERRQWPRLDLSARKGKGVLVRVTLESGEPINGTARNISAVSPAHQKTIQSFIANTP